VGGLPTIALPSRQARSGVPRFSGGAPRGEAEPAPAGAARRKAKGANPCPRPGGKEGAAALAAELSEPFRWVGYCAGPKGRRAVVAGARPPARKRIRYMHSSPIE